MYTPEELKKCFFLLLAVPTSGGAPLLWKSGH